MLSDNTIRREKKYNIFYRIIVAIRKYKSKKFREIRNNEIKDKLKDVGEFTIFSNNCLGGVFYHDSGREFRSPLINTAMDAEDFIKFCNNPKHYINSELEFFEWPGRNFPIARIDDIEVNFVHYKTKEECIEKWKSRCEKIVWDNIFIIATNHDGMYQEKWMNAFDKLQYKNKLMFVSKEYSQYNWAVLIKQFRGRFQCKVTTAFANMKGYRYYETAFDIAAWIKNKTMK